MKKIFIFCLLCFTLQAQYFKEVIGTAFEPIQAGALDHADIDGDGDEDVFLTGYSNTTGTYEVVANLYINNGCGGFTLASGTTFQGVYKGSALFGDLDLDGDQDLVISGRTFPNNGAYITKLYINNGLNSGVFTEVSTPLEGVEGRLSLVDVDGINGPDIFVGGYNGSSFVAKVYLNNGSGSFTLSSSNPFNGKYISAMDFGDIDGDGDFDFVFTSSSETKFYKNDGLGNFSIFNNPPIKYLGLSTINLEDFDNDGEYDLLISGVDYSAGYVRTLKLYKNDGLGNFNEFYNSFFNGYQQASVEICDIDLDGDKDFVISGSVDLRPYRSTWLYLNDGNGTFGKPRLNLLPLAVTSAANLFFDANGDGSNDLLLAGYSTKMRRNCISTSSQLTQSILVTHIHG